MLPKNRRISREEFKLFSFAKNAYHSAILSMFVYRQNVIVGTESAKKTESKFSFSVSKKVSKKAVTRNKLRRRGYVSVKKYLEHIPQGFFVHFVFKKGAEKSTYKQIEEEVYGLLKRI